MRGCRRVTYRLALRQWRLPNRRQAMPMRSGGLPPQHRAEMSIASWKVLMHFIKRYWVAGLVLALVGLHAAIIGHVRSEATRIQITTSSEIPVGVYYVQSPDKLWMSQLRIHVLVPPAKRLAAKATIERHRWLVHEAIEERLHQLAPELLQDAVLLEVKEQIKLALEEALQEEIIERVLVNDRVEIPIHRIGYPIEDVLTRPEAIYTSDQDVGSPALDNMPDLGARPAAEPQVD